MVCTAGQMVLMVLERVATGKTQKDPPVSVGYHHSGIHSTDYSKYIHHVYHKASTRDHILIQVNRIHL